MQLAQLIVLEAASRIADQLNGRQVRDERRDHEQVVIAIVQLNDDSVVLFVSIVAAHLNMGAIIEEVVARFTDQSDFVLSELQPDAPWFEGVI